MPLDLSPLWISLKTAALATCITVILGLATAYWMLGYRGRWKSLLEAIFIAPLVLPPTVVGFLLLVALGKNGPVGQLLPSLRIVFTGYAAVLTGTVVAFPLMYKTALGAFSQIDATLLQAARTLGASELKVFWRIMIPLALPGILAGATLAFARALGEFGATLMLAGNIPGQTQTIPMAIYFAVEAGDTAEAWFWSGVILGISLSVIMVVNIGSRHSTNRPPQGSADPALGSSPALLRQTGELGTAQHFSHLTVDIRKQLLGFPLNVSFAAQGQPLGVLGASGAGKSLLLRCIAGIETPDSGQIVLNGRVLFDAERRINMSSRKRRVALVFQNYALFPHLNVAQNIAFGLPPALSAKQQHQKIADQLSTFQLEGLAQRYPHQLSGGQQQRVAIARALASQPEALLLDEPFSALDTHLRYQVEAQMLRGLADYGGATLFVTHNLEEAYRVCKNLLVLEGGSVIAAGPKHHIFENPATLSVARLTGCKNVSQATVNGPGSIYAIDWDCTLQVTTAIPADLAQVGIRAHQLLFRAAPPKQSLDISANLFPCWLSAVRETPHRMTLLLKLHSVPVSANDYDLQAEVFKEKWRLLKDRPLPWYVELSPTCLMLLSKRDPEV